MSELGNSKLETVAERIIHYRRQRKMSQEELGRRCGGWTQTRIGNYERGVRMPDQDTLNRIARVLRIRPEYLTDPVSYVPVIKPECVKFIKRGHKIPKRIMLGYCPAPPTMKRSSEAFAAQVFSPAMSPVFCSDDYSIVDPHAELESGCYVMVLKNDLPIIRKYIRDNGDETLCGIDEAHTPPELLGKNDRVIGRITSKITIFS